MTKMENIRNHLKNIHKYEQDDENFLAQILFNITENYECLRHSMEVQLEQSTDTYLVRSRFLQPLETILKRSGSELIRDFDQLVIDAEMTNRGIQQSN